MEHARLFAPRVPVFRRLAYAALRDRGARRAHAAEVAGVSYSTAERIDSAESRCGQCGRPRER